MCRTSESAPHARARTHSAPIAPRACSRLLRDHTPQRAGGCVAVLARARSCKSIQQMVVGEGAAADARRTLGAEGGAIAAALGAMGAHPEAAGVQEHGVRCLQQLCRGSDVGQDVRAEVALALGAMECVRSAIEIHGQNPSISLACCGLVEALCTGADALPRQQKVSDRAAHEAHIPVRPVLGAPPRKSLCHSCALPTGCRGGRALPPRPADQDARRRELCRSGGDLRGDRRATRARGQGPRRRSRSGLARQGWSHRVSCMVLI